MLRVRSRSSPRRLADVTHGSPFTVVTSIGSSADTRWIAVDRRPEAHRRRHRQLERGDRARVESVELVKPGRCSM
jgi:hypothetical protein